MFERNEQAKDVIKQSGATWCGWYDGWRLKNPEGKFLHCLTLIQRIPLPVLCTSAYRQLIQWIGLDMWGQAGPTQRSTAFWWLHRRINIDIYKYRSIDGSMWTRERERAWLDCILQKPWHGPRHGHATDSRLSHRDNVTVAELHESGHLSLAIQWKLICSMVKTWYVNYDHPTIITDSIQWNIL